MANIKRQKDERKGNRLPLFILKGKQKGPMISLVTRLLIVATVYVSVVTAILILLPAQRVTLLTVVALIIWGIVPIGVSYLFWRPRYRVL
jgi:hypothetical protein